MIASERYSLRIDRMRIHACHGVMPQERIVGNEFELSLRLDLDRSVAEGAANDSLDLTVNYAEVIETIRNEMKRESLLLENVVRRIAVAILSRFDAIEGGCIDLRKLTPPCGVECEGVGVTISFSR
ncbi:MAG: dihydroneopterin aldolase [Paramuribaculum sp.]|nr:dihydroneopterin aldolase [Paramuribaculum sp.]